jgi:hypothetical protein
LDGSGIYFAVTVEVNVPNAAMLTKNGSPMARLAKRICPDVLELRKITCPTPLVETLTISCIDEIFVSSSFDFSGCGGATVVENHDNRGGGGNEEDDARFPYTLLHITTDRSRGNRCCCRWNPTRKC